MRIRELCGVGLLAILPLFAQAQLVSGSPGGYQWCYGSTCYDSQAEAEIAMKAEINPLDPKGRHLLSLAVPELGPQPDSIADKRMLPDEAVFGSWPEITIDYDVKDTASSFQEKWYSNDGPTFLDCSDASNLNTGFGCKALGVLESRIEEFYEASGLCSADWEPTEKLTPLIGKVDTWNSGAAYMGAPTNRWIYIQASRTPPNVGKVTRTSGCGQPFVFDHGFSRTELRLCPVHFTGKFNKPNRELPPPSIWPLLCGNSEVGTITTRLTQFNSCESDTARPCAPATGQKTRNEIDFAIDGFQLTRSYHSSIQIASAAGLGENWTHNFDSHLLSTTPRNTPASGGPLSMFVVDERGNLEQFVVVSTDVYRSVNDPGKVLRKRGTPLKWELQVNASTTNYYHDLLDINDQPLGAKSGRLERIVTRNEPQLDLVLTHDFNGRLHRVINAKGRAIEFRYEGWDPAMPLSPGGWNLSTIVLPDGSEYQYTVDATGNLAAVGYPSSGSRNYSYTKPGFPRHLTGITDENSDTYALFGYDSIGRVTSSTLKTGNVSVPDAEWVTLTYNQGNSTTVTKSTGEVINYAFGNDPFQKLLAVSGDSGALSEKMYRPDGRVDHRIDKKGIRTWFGYDALHQTIRIDAQGDDTQPANPYSNERRTDTDWDAALDVVTERRVYRCPAPDTGPQPCTGAASTRWELESLSRFAYNARGQAIARCEVDPGNTAAMAYVCGSSADAPARVRQTTTQYCEAADVTAGTCPLLGLVKTTDGARTDVADITTFSYYAADDSVCASAPTTCTYRKGDLWKVTNALNQKTEYVSYDGAGRVTRMKDANGTFSDLTYHPRGWLLTRTVRHDALGTPNATLDATTTLTYDNVGQVTRITQADSAYIDYSYDDAHRLTTITDNLGNSIGYTLDAAGNRIAEATRDPSNVLTRTMGRVYDSLGRLHKQLNAQNAETVFTYDANGNQNTMTDALSRVTDSDVDPLNRLIQTTDALMGSTKYRYDARDNLVEVVDAKGIPTGYEYDALGDLRELDSRDTGLTSYLYDSAGNRSSHTDARGVVSTYSYDALNRLTGIVYPTAANNVTFNYDEGFLTCASDEQFQKGRLTSFTDPSGSTKLCYDRRGNVKRKIAVVNGVTLTTRWSYNLADRITQLVYPSGTAANYSRDSLGRISMIKVTPAGSSEQTLISGVSYYPFGPVKQITWGNGATSVRSYDQNYWIDSINSSQATGLDLDFSLDPVGNITGISDAIGGQPPNNTYVYDALYRLQDVSNPTGAAEGYTYDAIGNRTSKVVDPGFGAAQNFPYVYGATTHRLLSVAGVERSYDNNGNTLKRDSLNGSAPMFSYDDRNRFSGVSQPGTSVVYQHNARGERVLKNINNFGKPSRAFSYDESGRLLVELNHTIATQQEYVWLDDLPVGLLASGVLHHIQPDHLGSPRKVVQASSNTAIWDWPILNNPFGEAAPNQDPDGDSTAFTLNLRFPGQYFDVETGLHYNYFRDYEPGTGRYVESDPIGLRGGVSTFGYVGGNSLSFTDPQGLEIPQRDWPGYNPNFPLPPPSPGSGLSLTCDEVCQLTALVLCGGVAEVGTPLSVIACGAAFVVICSRSCADDPSCPPADTFAPPPPPPPPPPLPPSRPTLPQPLI
jgi:RHS repeat-associated protein